MTQTVVFKMPTTLNVLQFLLLVVFNLSQLLITCEAAEQLISPSPRYCTSYKGQPGVKTKDDLHTLANSGCPGPRGYVCCEDTSNPEGIQQLNQTDVCGVYNELKFMNGKEWPVHAMPWMAVLLYKDIIEKRPLLEQFGCTGTLITERFVLTVAQCLSTEPELFQVRLGDHRLNHEVYCGRHMCEYQYMTFGIEKKIVHEGFEHPLLRDNIGLVKLAGTVEYKIHIRPICLPLDGDLRNLALTETRFQTTGWGQLEPYKLTDILRSTFLTRTNASDCDESLGDAIFCLKDSSACIATIGCPLWNPYILNGSQRIVQVGIASSFLGQCGAEKPISYINLGEYIPWISHKIVDE